VITSPSDVYTEYVDPRHDEWATVLPKLKAMPLRELMERTGLPRSTLKAIRAGRRPHPGNARRLAQIVRSVDVPLSTVSVSLIKTRPWGNR